MKYPNRTSGPSRNISASPTASRQAAAGTSRGGRITSEIAMPSPAASSRPTETTCPAAPIAVSR